MHPLSGVATAKTTRLQSLGVASLSVAYGEEQGHDSGTAKS